MQVQVSTLRCSGFDSSAVSNKSSNYPSLYTVFQMRHIEVDQVSQPDLTQPQISQQLRLTYRIHLLHSLQFDNNTMIDQHIKPQTGFKLHSSKHNWKFHFCFN